MKLLIVLFVLLLCSGCKKEYFDSNNASIKNMSDKNIILIQDYSFFDLRENDTIINEDYSIYEKSTRVLKPGNSYIFKYWNQKKANAISSTDTFSVFILDEEIYYICSWLDICKNYKVLTRYDLSGDDIINLQFTVPYPPSAAMKDMKMYPPYEEIIKETE